MMNEFESTRKQGANRLLHEKSPYLLQHARNPVDWFPWGDEAFETARKLDRPVFLSIGYATCHWCHVMEKESFEHPEVAALMNRAFVSVKVDREERPDLDHVYMTVCQMLTGSGGWPLTIVMTPDRQPFFAATYIPRTQRFGRKGMIELIPGIQEVWKNRREEVLQSAGRIVGALKAAARPEGGEDPGKADMDRAYGELAASYDPRHGGFGKAPKFPSPHNLLFLLRTWRRDRNPKALEMVETTLRAMRRGGVYDHVGYGFHRYSTDPEWLVPHFEKMLYDQAMLALAFTEAWQATGRDLYRKTAEEIFTYVLRDMTTSEGGFCTAEDADSEGEEGRFFVWTEGEIRGALSKDDADLAIRVFGVTPEGNFSDEVSGRRTGANILHIREDLGDLALRMGMSQEELEERIEAVRRRLFSVREGRVHPLRDDKVLTDWNGLMIAALARGARAFGVSRYAEAATRAAAFLSQRLNGPDGLLLHRFREGEAGIEGHLDDYAFLAWGLIELYEATFDEAHLSRALELTEEMRSRFEDVDRGGFFFTARGAEELIVRKMETQDAAVPSGNSVAALVLLRLARLTGRTGLEEGAWGIFRALGGSVRQFPSAFTFLLTALDFGLGPAMEVVIVGPEQAEETHALLDVLRTGFRPGMSVLFRPVNRDTSEIDRLAPFVRDYGMQEGKASAYVCTDQACSAPVTDSQDLWKALA